jgi:hypothetical protein
MTQPPNGPYQPGPNQQNQPPYPHQPQYGPPPGQPHGPNYVQYGAPAQPPAPHPGVAAPYVIPPKGVNHGAHIIADIVTLGFWVPFHLLIWALASRKSKVVMPDGRVIKR